MKLCSDATWHAKDKLKGFPYIDCIIPLDTAGFKNISIVIAGQQDSCSTNKKLCGYPSNFPTDRQVKRIESNFDISNLVGDASVGLVFTCAKSTLKEREDGEPQTGQSYARPGELCQTTSNGECEDEDCTKPKADRGFWRLDLDLQFACASDGSSAPCQEDITGNTKFSSASLADSLNPWAKEDSGSICSAGTQGVGDKLACASGNRLCSDRGGNAPGTCLFRRPLEARRALGDDFWPWSCPGTQLSAAANEEDRVACKQANTEAYDFVQNIERAGCPASRVNHLVNLTTYDEFPSLKMSPLCYSVVACNPKTSCLGDNQCGEGYEYQKYKCMAWNKKNPEKLSCTNDDQCRSRSNSATGKESGLSSACDANHPEDCSRCVFNSEDKSATVGTCECVGGGPRCGLCRLAIDKDNSADGLEYKGYFRLNDECQECPDNPWLLLILMAAAVVLFCVVGWWMQDKKVNVAFVSIGVDYFQVLAIFARIRIRWPQWMRDILQVLSIFNFNIDIAAPECVIPDFDYKIKWIVIMLLPLIFAGILFLIFLFIVVLKCIKKMAGCSGKATRYCSHGNKLIAMFIVIFYFIYLSVTRRALDVFNCNPVDPPE